MDATEEIAGILREAVEPERVARAAVTVRELRVEARRMAEFDPDAPPLLRAASSVVHAASELLAMSIEGPATVEGMFILEALRLEEAHLALEQLRSSATWQAWPETASLPEFGMRTAPNAIELASAVGATIFIELSAACECSGLGKTAEHLLGYPEPLLADDVPLSHPGIDQWRRVALCGLAERLPVPAAQIRLERDRLLILLRREYREAQQRAEQPSGDVATHQATISKKELVQALDCNPTTVQNWAKRAGVQPRDSRGHPYTADERDEILRTILDPDSGASAHLREKARMLQEEVGK